VAGAAQKSDDFTSQRPKVQAKKDIRIPLAQIPASKLICRNDVEGGGGVVGLLSMMWLVTLQLVAGKSCYGDPEIKNVWTLA
jgi:hypothetical protein